MGRIKTKLVKRMTKSIISQFGDRLKNNFEENKKVIAEIADIKSRKIRNTIAGYVTKSVKAQKQE